MDIFKVYLVKFLKKIKLIQGNFSSYICDTIISTVSGCTYLGAIMPLRFGVCVCVCVVISKFGKTS